MSVSFNRAPQRPPCLLRTLTHSKKSHVGLQLWMREHVCISVCGVCVTLFILFEPVPPCKNLFQCMSKLVVVRVKECRPQRSPLLPYTETPAGWRRRESEQRPRRPPRCGTTGGSGTVTQDERQKKSKLNTVEKIVGYIQKKYRTIIKNIYKKQKIKKKESNS